MAVKLYSLGIFLYSLGIKTAALFNPKAKKFIQGRIDLIQDLIKKLDPTKEKVLFHCASVGEFEQALPLWKKMQQTYPNYQYIFSFFSPSGYEYALKNHPDLSITYLPIDTIKNACEFVTVLQPKLAFFIKYEFWHNHLFALHQSNIPIFLVSGIFRKEQPFFKWYGAFYRNTLAYFEHFFVQNEVSINLLQSIGYKNASLTGDTRYERVFDNKKAPFQDDKIEEFIGKSNLLICGSIWASDMPILTSVIQHLNSNWKVIIVPHEPNHFNLNAEFEASFYSEELKKDTNLLIIDKVGVLSKLYRYATIAYIGGGFGQGIHNILEPAVYKIPIIIGPNHTKFQEAQDLIELGQVIVASKLNLESVLLAAQNIPAITLDNSYTIMTQKANVSAQILVLIKKHCI